MSGEQREVWGWLVLVVIVLTLFGGLIAGGCYAYPKYRVYQMRQDGVAQLARAEAERQVQVRDAEAKNEAALSQAQARVTIAKAESQAAIEKAKGDSAAEVERAKGVAEANQIIGDSLNGRTDYLTYLWLQGLGAANSVVYVPTEANLPLLEAGKRPGGGS